MKMCSKNDRKLKRIKTGDNNATLLTLNENCLLHILNYLPIVDIVKTEQTCHRLKNVAHLHYRTTKTFEWTSHLPFACASKIIEKFGRYKTSLHSLHFNGVQKAASEDYNNFIGAILDNCKDIKSLKFIDCDVGYEWAPYFDALQHLESLSLHNTQLRNSNYLRRVSTLKHLEVRGLNNFTSAKFNYLLAMNDRLETVHCSLPLDNTKT